MAKDFQEYMDTEIQEMLREVERVCPVDSPLFNEVAMAWIAKNAAKFRTMWGRFGVKDRDGTINN
jgi:hypothetical protein